MIEERLTPPPRDLAYSQFAGSDLHALLASLRREAPISWIAAMEGWLITGHELAVTVTSSPELFTVADPRFSTTHVIGPSMVSHDGLEHRRQRQPFAEALRRREVQDAAAAVTAATADETIAILRSRGAAEIRAEFAGPVIAAAIASMLGVNDVPPATLLAWCTAIDEEVEEVTIGAPKGAGNAAALDALSATIARSIDQPQNRSILGAVASASELDRDELLGNAVFLALASINPEAAILNALFYLLQDARQLELVRDDPELLRGSIAESQRLEPATAFIDRYATADLTLGGCAVGRGDLVRVSISAANRDPSVFPDPDRFDSRRSNQRRQMTFATGPHMCIGIHLTRLEARVAMHRLIRALPGLRLDTRHHDRPAGLIFRKPAALHVLWDT